MASRVGFDPPALWVATWSEHDRVALSKSGQPPAREAEGWLL